MFKIGLTGNIGSGKTMVAAVFKTLGIPVFNADFEAKILLNSEKIKTQVREVFGETIFFDNKIDRKKLADIVFRDKSALEKLNSIIHPTVRESFENWSAKIHDNPYLIYEAAIIFESGFYKSLDYKIMISADEEIRIKRVMNRDNLTKEMVLIRMKNQWPEYQKCKIADFVLLNENQNLLIPQILKLHQDLLDLSGKA